MIAKVNWMTDLITVIIPVYNVLPYLNKCIESVLYQTYSNLEIIVIDDGSTDGSEKVCDEYASLDNRISVIHQSNQGLSVARNVGLDKATGDWVAFVDSDDFLSLNMYESMLNTAHNYNVEVVSCSFNKVFDGSIIESSNNGNVVDVTLFDYPEVLKGLVTQEIIRFEVWNKLWKRNLVESIRFIPNQVSEDVHWDRVVFPRVKRLAHINYPLYNYRINRPGSTSTSFKMGRLCVFDEFKQWKQDLLDMDLPSEIRTIHVIELLFAIIIYENAYSTKQSKALLNQLFTVFQEIYKEDIDIDNNKLNFLFKFFSKTPNLYCYAISLRRMLHA